MKHPAVSREDVIYFVCRFRSLDISKLDARRLKTAYCARSLKRRTPPPRNRTEPKLPEQIPVRAIFCSLLALSPSAW